MKNERYIQIFPLKIVTFYGNNGGLIRTFDLTDVAGCTFNLTAPINYTIHFQPGYVLPPKGLFRYKLNQVNCKAGILLVTNL